MHPRGYEANFLDIALQQSCVSVRGILSPNGAEEVGDTEGRKGPVIEAVAALGVVCDVVPSEEHAVTQPEEADDGPPQPPQGGAGLALSQDFFFLPLRIVFSIFIYFSMGDLLLLAITCVCRLHWSFLQKENIS